MLCNPLFVVGNDVQNAPRALCIVCSQQPRSKWPHFFAKKNEQCEATKLLFSMLGNYLGKSPICNINV